ALMTHTEHNCVDLSKSLLRAATLKGSRALGFKSKGIIKKDYDADIICLKMPDKIESVDDIALNIKLHTKFVKQMYIGGEIV
ncbi:MAG: amidohydrolase family protein, partial [Sulfurovum sp.]